MLFLGKAVTDLQHSDIQQLLGRERESKTMEFKRQLPGQNMQKFVATVASFANSSGGHIVFGIEEAGGKAVAVRGLSESDPDAEMLTLQNSLNASIRPVVPSVEMSPIDMENGTWVLVVGVPRSWRPPHMVTRGGSQIFYARHTNGMHPMDIDEIRSAFLLSESYTERMRRFVAERREAFAQGRIGALPLYDSILFMHLMPLSAFTQGAQLDPAALLRSDEWRGLKIAADNANNERLNIDGVAAYSITHGKTSRLVTHLQVFRNGAVELMSAGSLGRPDERLIPSESFDDVIIGTCHASMKLLTQQGIDAPLLLSISLVGVRGYRFDLPHGLPRRVHGHEFVIDRDELYLPDLVLDKCSTSWSETIDLLKPCLDALWQSAGHQGWLTEHVCRDLGRYR